MRGSLAVQAEQALLGAVLLDPAGQRHVLDLVEPGDMQRPWHAQVLEAMRRAQKNGAAPGPAEVYRELQRDLGLPGSVSRDAVPLADLMEAAPRVRHAAAYAAAVIEGGIRRRVGLGGSRLAQAAQDGDLEAAVGQARWARRDVDACRERWLALPTEFRPDVAVASPGGRSREGAGWVAAVREEMGQLRADLDAGNEAQAGERLGVIARYVAEAAGASVSARRRSPGVARPRGPGAEAVGVRALQDLAASPARLAEVSGWLRPEHFAQARDGDLFALMRDMQAAGMPVDVVTVAWQAARRGVHADPAALAGGTGAFAVASAREVHRHGMLAHAGQAGRDIQADAANPRCPPGLLLASAGERLHALEAAPGPERELTREGQAVAIARRGDRAGHARATGREALR